MVFLKPVSFVFIVLALSALCSCTAGRQSSNQMKTQDGNEWAVVAVVGGTDHVTQDMVSQVLREKGIESTSEGSVVYSVYVHGLHLAEARKLLQQDARLKGPPASASARPAL